MLRFTTMQAHFIKIKSSEAGNHWIDVQCFGPSEVSICSLDPVWLLTTNSCRWWGGGFLTCGRCISMPTEAHWSLAHNQIAFHVSMLRLLLRVSTTEKTRGLVYKGVCTKMLRKQGGNLHTHLSPPTLWYLEKFWASFHPGVKVPQSFTNGNLQTPIIPKEEEHSLNT